MTIDSWPSQYSPIADKIDRIIYSMIEPYDIKRSESACNHTHQRSAKYPLWKSMDPPENLGFMEAWNPLKDMRIT